MNTYIFREMTEAISPTAIGVASVPHLACYFRSRNENGDVTGEDETSGKALLFQETGKKSSYILQPPKDADAKNDTDCYSIPIPAHLVVENGKQFTSTTTAQPKTNQDCAFFFGGLQILSSAKNIEIYLTNQEGDETHLMTCKGISYKFQEKDSVSTEPKSIGSTQWRKCLCVVPGGPRCISRLRVKFIEESDGTNTTLRYMKLTARIMDHFPSSLGTSTFKSHVPTQTPQVAKNPLGFNSHGVFPAPITANTTSNSEPPLTQKDLGAAMSGLSFMARKTEENLTEMFKQHSKTIEKQLESYVKKMELQMRALQPTLAVQHQLLQENQIIMKEQQAQINKLHSDNQDLRVRVQSLQADISILRSQPLRSNIEEESSCSKPKNIEMSESREIAKLLSGSQPPVDDNNPNASALENEDENVKIENVHLRKVIYDVARGIEEDPLLTGCGAIGDPAMTTEKNSWKHAETGDDMNSNENRLKKAVYLGAREIEEIPSIGGCGSMLYDIEGGIMKKIDSAISSSVDPSSIPLDTTRSIEGIQKKYCEEYYNNTQNIEVALVQDESTEVDTEESDDGEMGDET